MLRMAEARSTNVFSEAVEQEHATPKGRYFGVFSPNISLLQEISILFEFLFSKLSILCIWDLQRKCSGLRPRNSRGEGPAARPDQGLRELKTFQTSARPAGAGLPTQEFDAFIFDKSLQLEGSLLQSLRQGFMMTHIQRKQVLQAQLGTVKMEALRRREPENPSPPEPGGAQAGPTFLQEQLVERGVHVLPGHVSFAPG